MRRIERLFEIIQILRGRSRSITAQELSDTLEVSTRTVYRDIQALLAMRTPIDGEAGVGYIMRQGYDLPPINFSAVEIEAIVVGLNMLSRTGDKSLEKAAQRVAFKIESVRERMESLQSSDWGAKPPPNIELGTLREAIREERKLAIHYQDENMDKSKRTILPIAIIYYTEVSVLVAWCELRKDFRHFRADRILSCEPLPDYFQKQGDKLRKHWNRQQAS